ncbi:hypothetical protein DZC73_01950 [Albitalea terrae]|uniref:Uncharacterized protein n=2 Tax=Piscinibacter terrae TaxID=2496871 RepID=A0A3N7HVH1_9BURK|nr:hypothetical protein DZC73_01950 [Albitalea terrae]
MPSTRAGIAGNAQASQARQVGSTALTSFFRSRSAEDLIATASKGLEAEHHALKAQIETASTPEKFSALSVALDSQPPASQTQGAAALGERFAKHIEHMGFQDGFNTLKTMAELAAKLKTHPGSAANVADFADAMLRASSRIIKEANGPNGAGLTPDNRRNIAKQARVLQEALGQALAANDSGRTPARFEKLLGSAFGTGTLVSAEFGLNKLPCLTSHMPSATDQDKARIAAMLLQILTCAKGPIGMEAVCQPRLDPKVGPFHAVHQVIADRGLDLAKYPPLKELLDGLQESADLSHALYGTPAEVAEKMHQFAAEDGLKMKAASPQTIHAETVRSFGYLIDAAKANNPAALPQVIASVLDAYAPFVDDRQAMIEQLVKDHGVMGAAHATRGTPQEVARELTSVATADIKMRKAAADNALSRPQSTVESLHWTEPTDADLNAMIEGQTLQNFEAQSRRLQAENPAALQAGVQAMARAYAPFVRDAVKLDPQAMLDKLAAG